eukprot:UN08357
MRDQDLARLIEELDDDEADTKLLHYIVNKDAQQQSTDCGKYAIYIVSIVGLLLAIWNEIWKKGLKKNTKSVLKILSFYAN